MGVISWELMAISVARYAHELRIPVGTALEKLLANANLPSDSYNHVVNDIEIVNGKTSATGQKDSRYLSVMKRAITDALIRLRSVNKSGTVSSDTSIIEFYNSNIGSVLLQSLYGALNGFNSTPIGSDIYGSTNDRELPFNILASSDPEGTKARFNLPGDTLSLVPGLVIKGTDRGIGQSSGGVNLLPQREYSQSDGLSNCSLDPTYLGNITIEFYPGGTATTHDVPAIPPGTPNTGAYQQWIGMEPGGYVSDYWVMDERTNHLNPPNFQNAQWKTTLPAGSYKLHCELIQINGEIGWFADIYDRQGDWKNYTSVDLITSTGIVLIHRNVESASYSPSEDVLFANYRANYGPVFLHEEIPFTLNEETEIGMITKLYWYYNRRGDIYFRFYITDASVVAQPFDDGTYSGVTAWEPCQNVTKIHVTATNLLDGSTYTEEIQRNTPLYSEDSEFVFLDNHEIENAVSDGIIEIKVEEQDEDGKSGTASLVWLR